MSYVVVYDLPEFDTGQYEGFEFVMDEGDASLRIRVAELGAITITFCRVRWHQFTAAPNCTAELVEGAYFRLVNVASPALQAFLAADSSTLKAYSGLHHFRIFLDESGCHELFAESFNVVKPAAQLQC